MAQPPIQLDAATGALECAVAWARAGFMRFDHIKVSTHTDDSVFGIASALDALNANAARCLQ
jgi:hypothetical protein